MNSIERRAEMLKILEKSEKPITARAFSEIFGVCRQIIVSDVAKLKESGVPILSSSRGYIMKKEIVCSRIFKVIHSDEDVEKELALITETGGVVEDVFVFHRVYGKLSAHLGISCCFQIKKFLNEINSGKSSLLKNVTAGYHYHTVTAENEEILDKIEQELSKNGFLAPLRSYEPIGIGENRY